VGDAFEQGERERERELGCVFFGLELSRSMYIYEQGDKSRPREETERSFTVTLLAHYIYIKINK
jgi:hypothetical protein